MIARRLAVAAAVASVVLVGPAAATPAVAADDAATVNEAGISVDEFDELVTALQDAGLADFATDDGSSTIGGDPGRAALTLLITNTAQRQFSDQLGLPEVSDDDRAAATPNIPPDDPLRQNTAAYQPIADDAAYRARLDAIEAPDVESLGGQYEESPASLGAYCVTALITAERGAAESLIDGVGAAADTSWEAIAETAGASVSDWQCTPLSSVADPGLLASLADAQPGDPVGPVRTTDGYAVLVVDKFDDAAPKLESLFLRLADGGATSVGFVLFQGFLLESEIRVNPRFGRWDPVSGSVVALGT